MGAQRGAADAELLLMSRNGIKTMTLAKVEAAIAAIRRGEFVVVLDDEDRENEGDLIIAAECADERALSFFVRHTSGVICVGISGQRADELNLPPMTAQNSDPHRTAFTVSVDYRHGTSTGISAWDRSLTIRHLANPQAGAGDFLRPGHVFPLRARDGGVLERNGHTEAACDLARLAGFAPAGALCEIVDQDGRMVRGADLFQFAERHGLQTLKIQDLVSYRLRTEPQVERVAVSRLPTRYGEFHVFAYRSRFGGAEHLALVRGNPSSHRPVLTRLHSECLTGDVFGSGRCDCGAQLDEAMRRIAETDEGVIVYLRGHEGRGIGLAPKIQAYALQDRGRDTVEANLELGAPVDARNYEAAGHILKDLGVRKVDLLTNNPDKLEVLRGHFSHVDRVPLLSRPTKDNARYLRIKQQKLGHRLELPDAYVAARAAQDQQALRAQTQPQRDSAPIGEDFERHASC